MPHSTTRSFGDAVRVFNKHILNPAMLLLAGRKHWYAAVIRHIGRCSGRAYATPVVADRVATGFLVPLPYGTDVDWLRNTEAAGAARIVSQGRSYDVAGPRIVAASAAADMLSPWRRRVFHRFGIDLFAEFTLRDQPSDGNPER